MAIYIHNLKTGAWRDNQPDDPKRVVFGYMGREKIHFEAPAAEVLPDEMQKFISWFNTMEESDVVFPHLYRAGYYNVKKRQP